MYTAKSRNAKIQSRVFDVIHLYFSLNERYAEPGKSSKLSST